ncbi:MAG: hypothetical protein ABSB35_12775 [Bryobacteraceae bacterium]|jgi:alpha-glucosidase (family GH31 glycosyl hydrolase)
MRRVLLALCVITAARGGVVSRDWGQGRLTLKLDDGAAEMEWISPIAFRFARSWDGAIQALPKVSHDRIEPEFEEAGDRITMRTKYLTVEMDRADLKMSVKSAATPVVSNALNKTVGGVELKFGLAPDEKVFGLMGGTNGRLNLRGEKLERRNGFFFTSAGYGLSIRTPEVCAFDLASGTVEAMGARSFEYAFYYGPTPKEIMEEHMTVTGQHELKPDALDVLPENGLPKTATPLPKGPLDSWEAMRSLIQTLNNWSLSAVLYPAMDVGSFDSGAKDVKQRAADVSALFPTVYRSAGTGGIDVATREMWKPYLITYLREAFDRGLPVIRPLPMQFSKDANSDQQADVFMLGDEVLLAPVVGPGGRRRVDLPKGLWTDFRTNTEYRGNQTVQVDAPAGHVPMFVRNGWIVPLAMKDAMELHYFPSLGAEFFIWEPDKNDISQLHAAPAGDYVRVEIETQVSRTYEWILHHTKAAREVAEESTVYRRAAQRAQLRPGMWWHDSAKNDLHVMVQAAAGSDRIVNISF